MSDNRERNGVITEMKQHLNDFYYGKLHEEKNEQGEVVKVTTAIPSLRRKLKKAMEHDTVLPTADKWFRDFQTFLSDLQ